MHPLLQVAASNLDPKVATHTLWRFYQSLITVDACSTVTTLYVHGILWQLPCIKAASDPKSAKTASYVAWATARLSFTLQDPLLSTPEVDNCCVALAQRDHEAMLINNS